MGRKRAISVAISAVLATVVVGCGSAGKPAAGCPGAPTAPYTSYDVGPTFQSLKLLERSTLCEHGDAGGSVTPGASATAAGTKVPTQPIQFASVLYGPCNASSPPACRPELEIQSWPECRRNLASYSRGLLDARLNPIGDASTALLPEASFDGGTRIELYSGTTTIVVFADEPAVARSAAAIVTGKLSGLPSLTMLDAEALDPGLSCSGTLSGAFAAPPGGTGDLSNTYTRLPVGACGSSHAVDPINVAWSGPNATAGKVALDLGSWVGWSWNDLSISSLADHQAVAAGSACGQENGQRASSCLVCDRNHIRLFDVTAGSETFVVGDAHYDSNVFFNGGCVKYGIPVGHVSSSFTEPRDRIAGSWRVATPPARLAYWGDTRQLRQCDGSTPMNDGYVLELGT